jgi:hypothetical protein
VLLGIWYIHGLANDTGAVTIKKVHALQHALNLIREEWVISEKNWEELSIDEKKNERWSTMNRLVPMLQKLVGVGTPIAGKNINTIKTMSQKVGEGDYINWLEKSWTGEAQTELTQTQWDIAEIIPVFAGISEASSTESIGGKITLTSLVEYIQSNIVEQYGLSNVLGQIGINTVKFLPELGDIGIYEVPLQFEKVPNGHIINLLEFLGKTGGIRVTETGKNISIEHLISRPIKNTLKNESSLKNLLITVKDLTIIPSHVDERSGIYPVSTRARDNWDVHMTLQFYIRGVSRDHIATLDKTLSELLDKSGRPGSLITEGNNLLKNCNNCPAASSIKDIIVLLNNARTAYESILLQEKNPKNTYSPIEILEHRTELMTTIGTLEKKLTTLKKNIVPNK